MTKKVPVTIGLLLLAAATSFCAYRSHREAQAINPLAIANVEALTKDEMPHVKDCVYDEHMDCIALHPTDPRKDEYKKNARWPSK